MFTFMSMLLLHVSVHVHLHAHVKVFYVHVPVPVCVDVNVKFYLNYASLAVLVVYLFVLSFQGEGGPGGLYFDTKSIFIPRHFCGDTPFFLLLSSPFCLNSFLF